MSVSPYYFALQRFAFPVVAGGIIPSAGDARIIRLCDAVAAAIQAGLAVGDTTAVRRVYDPLVDVEAMTGRTVFVFPVAYEQAGTVSRGEDLNEYRVGVLAVEQYAIPDDVASAAGVLWTDARVKFVEAYVYDLLSSARVEDMRAELLAESVWPETAAVEVVYDPEMLREHKLFWSESLFALRRDE